MKKFLVALAAASLAVPSVASAETAAQALSVKASAASQPVRAAAQAGDTQAVKALPVVLILFIIGGAIWLIADSGSD